MLLYHFNCKAFFQDLDLEKLILMAASMSHEANNRDSHDLMLPLSVETLMIDQTLVLNMADIMGHYYYCHRDV